MSQQWTPEEQAAISQIMQMVDQEEAQGANVSRGVPDSLMRPQRPLIGMDQLLAVPQADPMAPPDMPIQTERKMPMDPAERPFYDSFLSPEASQSVYSAVENFKRGSPEEEQARREKFAGRRDRAAGTPRLKPQERQNVVDGANAAGEDHKINEYASAYGLSYSTAEAILRSRGYGRK